jgi:long-chain acyl-CoA synthetase
MVEFRDELPKSLVGKILRRILRAEEEAKQRDVAAGHEDEPCFDHELHEDLLHSHLPEIVEAPSAPSVVEEHDEETPQEKSV